jgi:hypothetical protein
MHDASSPASNGSRSRLPRIATLVFLAGCGALAIVATGLSLVLSRITSTADEGDWTQRGVSLGMTAVIVRESFLDGAAGEWRLVTACGGTGLEWTRSRPGVPTRWARFELHDGLLVAMRVHTDEPLSGMRTLQSTSAVRQDRPFEGGTATTILSRACSTHAAEVDQMVLSAAGSWIGGLVGR